MKYQNIIPAMLIFTVFLLTGVWIGRWLGHSLEANHLEARGRQLQSLVEFQNTNSGEHSNAPLPYPDQAEDNHPRQKQRNLLLIGIDNLDDHSPSLMSVWLILYIPDLPHIIWMPIYPGIEQSQQGVQVVSNADLAEAFQLDRDSAPSQEFLRALEGEGMRWDNYAIIDQTAAIDLIDALGGIEIAATESTALQKMSGEEAFAGLLSTSDDLQATLLSQAQLIHQLCRISSRYSINQQIGQIIVDFSNHLNTDIDPEQLISDLQTMRMHNGGYVCEFPSLALISTMR